MRQLPETIVVARIGRCHGVRGAVTVQVHSDVDERFVEGAKLLLVEDESASAPLRSLTIEKVRDHKGDLLLTFEGIADRDAAEALRGRWLGVPLAEVPAAKDGSYYYFELVGCEVFERSQGRVGIVRDLLEDGGGLLIEVVDEMDGTEKLYLIPFVERFLDSIDTEAARIEFDLPPGLLEACVSTS